MSLICITYFFSIFGVWFVHSLLLDDDMLHDNAVKLYNDCAGPGGGRDDLLPAGGQRRGHGDRSRSPTLGAPGEQLSGGGGGGSGSGRGRYRDPVGRQHSSGSGSGSSGRSSPVQYSPREALRDLQSANDRLARARTEDEAWGVSGLLWRLTVQGRGVVTVDMLRETRIARTTGPSASAPVGAAAARPATGVSSWRPGSGWPGTRSEAASRRRGRAAAVGGWTTAMKRGSAAATGSGVRGAVMVVVAAAAAAAWCLRTSTVTGGAAAPKTLAGVVDAPPERPAVHAGHPGAAGAHRVLGELQQRDGRGAVHRRPRDDDVHHHHVVVFGRRERTPPAARVTAAEQERSGPSVTIKIAARDNGDTRHEGRCFGGNACGNDRCIFGLRWTQVRML